MNLHELVYFRNSLQNAINLNGIRKEVESNQLTLHTIIPHVNTEYGQKVKDIADAHFQIFENAQKELDKINSLLAEVNNDIAEITKKFFEDNYQTECFLRDPHVLRRDKIMVMADESEDILLNRIHLYSTWKYPALEIGCRDGYWTKQLITFDPLYITDNHDEFLQSAVSQFTPEYQARVRQYKINDFRINNLPVNQFGFIFSYNYFNYLSLDSIKQFLHQAMEWLRPGGTILFTYNNADMSASAGMCESYFMTYVPKSMLVPMAESIGFSVVESFDFHPSTSWIEFRKPGVLQTVKAHQALGEIKFKQ